MQINYRQGVCSITMWCSLCTIGLFWNVASIGGFISYLMLHYLMMFISGLFLLCLPKAILILTYPNYIVEREIFNLKSPDYRELKFDIVLSLTIIDGFHDALLSSAFKNVFKCKRLRYETQPIQKTYSASNVWL